MEVVGAVSAVLGIVGIAGQALNGILELREFFRNFSESSDRIASFVREMNSLVQVIVEVKDLLEKLRPSITNLDMTLASLRIQLEDCSKDFEHFVRVHKELYPKHSSLSTSYQRRREKWNGKLMLEKFAVAANRKGWTQIMQEIECHKSSISLKLSVLGRSLNIAQSTTLQVVNKKIDIVQGLETSTQMLVAKNFHKLETFETQSRQTSSQTSECLSRLEAMISKQAEMIASIHGSIPSSSFAGSEFRREASDCAMLGGTEEVTMSGVFEDDLALQSGSDKPNETKIPPSSAGISNRHFPQSPEFEELRRANISMAKSMPDSVLQFNFLLLFLQTHNSFKAFASSNLEKLGSGGRHLYGNERLPMERISEVRYNCWIEGHNTEDLDSILARIIGCDESELPLLLMKRGTFISTVTSNCVAVEASRGDISREIPDAGVSCLYEDSTVESYTFPGQSSPNFRLWTYRHDRINAWLLQSLMECERGKARHRAMIGELLPLNNSFVNDVEWERAKLKYWQLDMAASIPLSNAPSTDGAVNSQGECHSEKVSIQAGEIQRMRRNHQNVPRPVLDSSSVSTGTNNEGLPYRSRKRQRTGIVGDAQESATSVCARA